MTRRIRRLLQKSRSEAELDQELRFHVDRQIADYVAAGLSPEEARRRARLEFGGLDRVKEEVRDTHWETHLDNLFRDFRYAIRNLRRDRRFTFIAILALALGIGASTVVFSVVYNLLSATFPYNDFKQSTVFEIHDLAEPEGGGRNLFSLPEFLAFREQNHVFEDVIGYSNDVNILYNDGHGVRDILGTSGAQSHAGSGGAYVTTNTFEFYGISALLGRGIGQEDEKPDAPPIFVMNYRLWRQMFNEDPRVLGKNFILNGEARTLVGIMPPRFQAYGSSVWLPLSLNGDLRGTTVRLRAIGRLKPGVSLEAAAADLTVVAEGLSKAHPREYPARFTMTAETLVDSLVGKFKSTLYALLAAVSMLLSIACSNVANLLLARATVREKDIAIRVSMGASRARLVQQALVESLVLAGGGCIVGCFLAYGSLNWLVELIPSHRIPDEVAIGLNPVILLFALGVSVASTLLCGLAPALHAVRRDLQGRLAGSGKRTGLGFQHGRLRASLVIAEVALSIVLLIGSGLMMRSFFALTHVNLGFSPGNVLYVRLDLPKGRYEATAQRKIFFQRVLDAIEALPRVIAAAETWSLPPEDAKSTGVTLPGATHSDGWEANIDLCSDGYFETLGLPLLNGRTFSKSDVDSSQHVAVINQTLARRFFGIRDPVGQKIKFNFLGFSDAPHNAYFEIIGVVADFRNAGLRYPPQPEALLPYTISGFGIPNILVRTAVDPNLLLKSTYQAVWSVDPNVGINMSGSLASILDEYVYEEPRFEFVTLGSFAAIGLFLVIIGVFGVMAYTVSLRTQEIGVRMALGAQQDAVLRMILKKGLSLVSAGILIGVLLSFGLTRFLVSQVWGVSVVDPWTFAAVVICVAGVGLLACLLPARRAAQVDPLVALRYE